MSPIFILLNLLILTSTNKECNASNANAKFTELHSKVKQFRDHLYHILAAKNIQENLFNGLNECLEHLHRGIEERETLIKRLNVRKEKIWLTNQPQSVETVVRVNGKVFVKESIMASKIRITVPRDITPRLNLRTRLEQAWESVNRIEDKIRNRVVRKDRDRQVINGTIHFSGPIKAKNVIVESIKSSTKINGITLAELQTNVLRKSGLQKVTGQWNFRSGLVVEDLRVNGYLSGINISNVLLTDSPNQQVITGRFKVQHGLFKSISFEDINGIKRDELVLRSNPNQKITGLKKFTNLRSVANINLTGRLNGYNWNHLVKHSINVNSPSAMINSLQFDTIPSIKTLQVQSVNNVRIDNLKDGLIPEELNHLSGFKTFRSLSASRVTLNGKLNNLRVETDLVTLRSLNKEPGTLIFDGNVSFNNSLTISKINDIDISRDAVRKVSNQPQVIRGMKIFDNDIKVSNIISRQAKLRHVNLNDFELNGNSFVKRSNVHYEGNLVINGSLQVGEINGIQINQLIDSLFSKSRDQKISWSTQLNGSLFIESASTQKINNISIPDDLFLVNAGNIEKKITGRKTFKQAVLESGDLQMQGHLLNGLTWSSVQGSTIQNACGSQKRCFGKKKFSSIDVMGNIIAERVNNLELEHDVMLVNKHQNLTGKWIFDNNIKVNQISFKSLNVHTINNNLVDDMLDKLVLHDDPSVTLENKDFRGSLFADDIALYGTVNGHDLKQLGSSVVRLDTPQTIFSPIRFEDEVTFDYSIDTRSVNGQDLRDHFGYDKTRSTNGNKKVTIKGNVFINGSVKVNRLNQEDPEFLRGFLIASKKDNQFKRRVIFNSTVTIEHLSIGKSISLNGIQPSDLIRLDQKIELDGSLTIQGNARIDSQLLVRSGIINNCSLQNIFKFGSQNNPGLFNFPNPINFTEVNILGNLRLIDNTINNVDIDLLGSQVIKLYGEQNFRSSLTFKDDIHVDELYAFGPINGIDIMDIRADSVQKSGPLQKITGKKIFKSLRISNGYAFFKGNITVAGLVNGFNFTKLKSEIVKPIDSHHLIRGRKVFYSDKPIVLKNIETPILARVNFSDIVLSYTNETIQNPVKFTQTVAAKRLEVQTHQARAITSGVVIKFKDPIFVEKLIVKRINGIPVENFASKTDLSILRGNYSFNNGKFDVRGDLRIDPKVTINKIHLSDLSSKPIDAETPLNFSDLLELYKENITKGALSLRARNLGLDYKNLNVSVLEGLKYLESSTDMQKKELDRMLKSFGESRPQFEFFDYVDNLIGFDIDADYIDKISISYDYQQQLNPEFDSWISRSIYLWFADRKEPCVQRTFSFDIHGVGKLQDRIINRIGHVFAPIIFNVNNTSIRVSAWTNSSSRHCARDTNQTHSHILFNSLSQSSLNDSYPEPDSYSIVPVKFFSDIKYFIDSQQIYAVTLVPHNDVFNTSSTLSVYWCTTGKLNASCVIIGSVNSSRAISIDLFYSRVLRTTLLAVLERPSGCSTLSPIHYFNWNQQKFVYQDMILSSNPSSMLFTEVLHSNQLYHIIANSIQNEDCSNNEIRRTNSSPNVTIYMFKLMESSVIKVELKQTLPLSVVSMSFFRLKHDQLFLVFSSRSSGKLYIYRHKESEGFKQIQVQDNKDGENVLCFWFSPKELLMLTTARNKEKAKIYKAFISGLNNSSFL